MWDFFIIIVVILSLLAGVALVLALLGTAFLGFCYGIVKFINICYYGLFNVDGETHTIQEPERKRQPASDTCKNADSLSSFGTQAKLLLVRFFTTGNLFVRIGIVIFMCGIAFLLGYAAQLGFFPPTARLISVSALGAGLIMLGHFLARKNKSFSLSLRGCGVGLIYLAIFFAFYKYQKINLWVAFDLLLVLNLVLCVLAMIEKSQVLAIFAVLGGLLAPILVQLNLIQFNVGIQYITYWALYYVLVDLSILILGWFESWPILNAISFFCTFLVVTLFNAYHPHKLSLITEELYLGAFFIEYFVTSITYAMQQAKKLNHYINGSLVFGLPTAILINQSILLNGSNYLLGSVVVGMALFYAVTSLLIIANKSIIKNLAYSFGLIAGILATIAIPLFFQVNLTAGVWAIEGACFIALGLKQKHAFEIFSGSLLQIFAAYILITRIDFAMQTNILPFLNPSFINGIIISIAGTFSFCSLFRYQMKTNIHTLNTLSFLYLGWSVFWWLKSVIMQLVTAVPAQYLLSAILLCIALTFALLTLLEHFSQIRKLCFLRGCLTFTAIIIGTPLQFFTFIQNDYAMYAWLLNMACGYLLLYQTEKQYYAEIVTQFMRTTGHAIAMAALIGFLVGKTLLFGGLNYETIVILGLIPSVILLAITLLSPSVRWPFQIYASLYQRNLPIALCGIILAWMLFMSAYALSLPASVTQYPVINILDLTALFAYSVSISAVCKNKENILGCFYFNAFLVIIIAHLLVLFVWANSVIARTIHYWYQIPYNYDAIMHSVLLQTTYSIFWSIIAAIMIIFAVQRKNRLLWFIGAGFMSIVVLKLLLVDLSNTATLGRIIAFIGVGGLLMIVGYFAPIPPAIKPTEELGATVE